ncbi:MAG: putative surface protein responsible for cell interaction [Herbinix sp.]|jgi:hypothetical protein|nr:putative surface protein responsible for cell interaction [Herbinix sp.]
MKKIRQLILAILLLVFIASPLDIPVLCKTEVAQAATLKISASKLVMMIGQTKELKITGSAKKVIWSSSKKSVATVSSKGNVTAVAAGNVVISAKVGDKKLTCSVSVVKDNPYLETAPFEAEEVQIDQINFIIPADWKIYSQNLNDNYSYTELTPPKDSNFNSIIRMEIRRQDGVPSDYEGFKEAFKNNYTEDILIPEWKEVFGKTKFEINDWEQSDFDAPYNTVLKTGYTVNSKGAVVTQTIYDFFIGEYVITLKAEAYDQKDLETITDYMINSFIVISE